MNQAKSAFNMIPLRDFKHLSWRAAFDKVLCNKALTIAKKPKYNGYQRGLGSMIYKFLDKNSTTFANESAASTHTGTGINSSSENKQLAKELHKPIKTF